MNYEYWRSIYWICDILASGLGLDALIAIISLLLPSWDIDEDYIITKLLNARKTDEKIERRKRQKKKRDIIRTIRIVISGILLAVLIAFAIVKYSGIANIDNVLGDEYLHIGQSLNGKADGRGEQRDTDENLIYTGEFKLNLYEGNGKKYVVLPINQYGDCASFIEYEGEFHRGVFDGYGEQYDNNFNTSLTSKSDGIVIDAEGILIACPNGEKTIYKPRLQYKGEFKAGQYCGEGTYYFNPADYDGNVWIYTGHFKDGKYNGYGELYCNGVLQQRGEYTDNQLINPLQENEMKNG